MSTLQVNTIETNIPAGVLAIRDVNNALTAIQLSAVRGTTANTAPVFQDSTGTPVGTLCRAWVNFNGTGTVAIRAAFNVSSVVDYGTGNYGVAFTNPMPDANYSVATTHAAPGSRALINYNSDVAGNFEAGYYAMIIGYYNSTTGGLTANDGSIVTVAIFR